MFDTHTHMQDPRLDACRDTALLAAAEAGVTGLCCCTTAPADWDAVATLVREPPPGAPSILVPAFGVHPWYVTALADDWGDRLDAHLLAHPTAAVGECGLDGMRRDIPAALQSAVLRHQLTLAESRGRPIVLHGARAWGALLEATRPFSERIPVCIAHSFGGSIELLRDWLQLGGYVSFSGTLCNPNATRVRAAAAATPADRLLIETDTPDLFPVGGTPCPGTAAPSAVGKKRALNHPGNLAVVLAALAEVRNTPSDVLAELTAANARKAFL